MDVNKIQDGMHVQTVSKLGETTGMTINPRHLRVRGPNKPGIVRGYVPGHGGDVWWVEHGPEETAAYTFEEFEPI